MGSDAKTGFAVITGAAGGIGRELALGLAKDGYNIFAVDRLEAELGALGIELASRYPDLQYSSLAMDLSKSDAAEILYAEVTKQNIHTAVLVNNVGFGKMGEHILQAPETMEQMLALNNLLMTKLCLYFGRDMKALGHGRILNVASLVGFSASPFFAAYSGSKAFVIAFSVAIARELAEYGVTVSCLCPGTTGTRFLDTAAIDDESSAGMRRFSSAFIATPDTVAKAALKGFDKGRLVIVPTAFLSLQSFFLRILTVEFVSGFVHRKVLRANQRVRKEAQS